MTSMASKRLGIMGGTFDPIHFGHLHCAERAREALGLDSVVFVPAGNPAFKQDGSVTDSTDRLAMCKLATADNPSFYVSAIETDRSGITYTVDTLEELRREVPDDTELVFILGADSLEYLTDWKDPDHLAELATFACVVRPGYPVCAEELDALAECGFRIEVVEAPLLDISSSQIRNMCSEGYSVRYLTPLSVCDYIEAHGLYERSQEG